MPCCMLVLAAPALLQGWRRLARTPSPALPGAACLALAQAAQAPWRKEHAVEVSGQSYYETGVGHMQR